MDSILNLPDELLEKILSYSSYDEISHLRLICKRFDIAAQHVLNHGFLKVEKYHSQCLRKVKAQLPRRESERRKHPLARHCDILTAVETRLSLLAMTFMKYVDLKCCCFIPGKVLDEIYKVLRYVTTEEAPARAHEILQELRDISSMAMEHFDEKIAPTFKKSKETGPKLAVTTYGGFSGSLHVKVANGPRTLDFTTKFFKMHHCMKALQNKQCALTKEFYSQQQKLVEQRRRTSELERKLTEQNNVITAQAAKIDEQDVRIEEINRKLVDNERVLGAMAEILNLRVDASNEPSTSSTTTTSSKKRKYHTPSKMETRQKRIKK